MKNILVLTDFSSAARNAELYAAALAQPFKAKLTLFHAYSIPLPVTDAPFAAISIKDLEQESKKALKKEAELIQKKYRARIDIKTRAGFATSEALEMEKRLKPDLVIMGMKGKTNAERILIGSVATDFIRKSATPVLLVPEKKRFHKPEKILLACDYAAPIVPKTLSRALEMAKKFDSDFYVVNVVSNGQETTPDKAKTGISLEKELDGAHYVYYFPHKKDVIEGLEYFLDRHKTDMIAMIPHKHNLFERLFGKSITRRMAFHTDIPLLALPEKHKSVPAYLI